ncbi:DUF63 family protein [Halobaculum sp. P14]|uniref:DUF63 family protein n=1 Tax=Halobaculum sp. P14 TaxID=3421638 RepID=UPI003EC0F288
MAILPEGFGLPPLPYLVALAVSLAGVGYALRERRPAFGAAQVLAAVPWMVAGAAGHALYVLGALPASAAPLFGTPSAYLTTAAVAGATWLAALRSTTSAEAAARLLGAVGVVAAGGVVARAIAYGATHGTLTPWLPLLGVVGGAVLGVVAAAVLFRVHAESAATGAVGALAVTAHAVDGVTTAVGVDLLGYGERTPLSRLIIEFAAGLPTAEALGAGWLFVAVKLVVAAAVVAAVAPVVEDEPTEGYLLLAGVTAVGLGPGVHNAILFAVSGA